MRTLIFSDTHLTDTFDQRRFDFLYQLIEPVDRVILNGDITDLYVSKFAKIERKWSDLFALLSRKDTVYLHGNHDRLSWLKKQNISFTEHVAQNYILPWQGVAFYITHGDGIWTSLVGRLPIIPRQKILGQFGIYRDQFGIFMGGKSFLNRYRRMNGKMKRWGRQHLQENQILVCGHTHLVEMDWENRFINTGFIRHGFAQYLLIDDDRIQLVDERY